MSETERPTDWHRTLVATFVSLTDTLTEHFDVVEFLQTLTEGTVELGLASESGILLSDPEGELHVMAASRERTRLLELFQLQSHEGPCLDCWRSGEPVTVEDLEQHRQRWPRFAPKALSVGFRSVYAVPLSLRETQLGALNLFHTDKGAASEGDRLVARGLADIATVGLLQQRTLRESQLAAEQLHLALQSRIIIEQAKGMLAARRGGSVDEAFALLRSFARDRNLRLTHLARALVEGEIRAEQLTEPR